MFGWPDQGVTVCEVVKTDVQKKIQLLRGKHCFCLDFIFLFSAMENLFGAKRKELERCRNFFEDKMSCFRCNSVVFMMPIGT